MDIPKFLVPVLFSLALFSLGCSSSSGGNKITKAFVATPGKEVASNRQFMHVSAQTGLAAANNGALEETDVSTVPKSNKKKKGCKPGYKHCKHEGGVLPSARGCCGVQGPYFAGSVLFWKAAYNDLSDSGYSQTVSGDQTIVTVKYPHSSYDPGFKAGFGYNLPGDAWDFFFNWTRFYTHSHLNLTSTPKFAVVPTLTTAPDVTATSSNSHGKIHVDVIDGEVGRNFFVGSYLAIRPYGGAKTVWLKTTLATTFSGVVPVVPGTVYTNLQDSFKNNLWGIGPRAGLESRWSLGTPYVAFLFDFAGSLLWDDIHYRSALTYTEGGVAEGGVVKKHLKTIRPILEIFAGMDFGGRIEDTNIALYFSAGWEAQYWFVVQPSLDEQSLELQGLTASLRLEF